MYVCMCGGGKKSEKEQSVNVDLWFYYSSST